jgi:hypothetical protein
VINQRQEHLAHSNASSEGELSRLAHKGYCPASTDLPGSGEQCELLRKRPGSLTELPERKKGSGATAPGKEQKAKQNHQEGKREVERYCHQK